MKFKFDQIAINSTAKKKPVPEDAAHYIGLEHLEPGTFEIANWGSDVAPVGEKLLMKKGDVLFGRRRAYQRKVGIAPFDGIFSAHGMVLRPKTEVVDARYFPFFISSDQFMNEAVRISVGSLSPTINWSTLKNCEFDLPPLDEQRKLADLLWAANDLKEKYKKAIAASDEMLKAKFREMFDLGRCVARPLWKCCGSPDDIKCGPFGTQLGYSEYCNDGVAVWEIPQVNSGCKEYPTRFVSVEKARQLKSYSVESGDLVMSRKGDVGKCALFPTWYEPGIIHSDVVRVRVDRSQLDPLFMLHQFHLNDAVRKQILDVSNGSIMKGINVGKLKEINVFVPPLALQQQFVEIARKADETKAALQKSIADVDNIIKGLING